MKTKNIEKAVSKMLAKARAKGMVGSGFGIMLTYHTETETFEVSDWVTANVIPNPNSDEVKIYWQPAWSGRFDGGYTEWKENLIEEIKWRLYDLI